MADHRVVAVGGHVYELVVQIHAEFDGRVDRQERVHHPAKVQRAEPDRSGQTQRPGQGSTPLRDLGLRLYRLAHDPARPFEEQLAFPGQGQLARRALHQARAEQSFQFGHALTDHRLGKAEAARRLADRSRFGHRYERGHSFQLHHRSAFPKAGSGIWRLVRTMA
jgi:hypothetical protein